MALAQLSEESWDLMGRCIIDKGNCYSFGKEKAIFKILKHDEAEFANLDQL